MWARSRQNMRVHGTGDVASDYKAIFELANAMHVRLVELNNVKENSSFSAAEEMPSSSGEDCLAVPATDGTNIGPFSYSVLATCELRRRIAKDLHGGSISYSIPLLQSGEADGTCTPELGFESRKRQWGCWVWAKEKIWWLLAHVGVIVLSMKWQKSLMFFPLELAFPTATLLGFSFGSTTQSRRVLFFWLYIILGVIPHVCLHAVFVWTS